MFAESTAGSWRRMSAGERQRSRLDVAICRCHAEGDDKRRFLPAAALYAIMKAREHLVDVAHHTRIHLSRSHDAFTVFCSPLTPEYAT